MICLNVKNFTPTYISNSQSSAKKHKPCYSIIMVTKSRWTKSDFEKYFDSKN